MKGENALGVKGKVKKELKGWKRVVISQGIHNKGDQISRDPNGQDNGRQIIHPE